MNSESLRFTTSKSAHLFLFYLTIRDSMNLVIIIVSCLACKIYNCFRWHCLNFLKKPQKPPQSVTWPHQYCCIAHWVRPEWRKHICEYLDFLRRAAVTSFACVLVFKTHSFRFLHYFESHWQYFESTLRPYYRTFWLNHKLKRVNLLLRMLRDTKFGNVISSATSMSSFIPTFIAIPHFQPW